MLGGKACIFPMQIVFKTSKQCCYSSPINLISSFHFLAAFLVQNYYYLFDEKVPFHRTCTLGQTESMLFGTGPNLALSTSFSIPINGKALNRVSEYKYLGGFSRCVAYMECAC